jgi:solute carrier family 25 carnitine/acylcarnitine transporter 20/29
VPAADPTRPPLISEISGAAVITGALISVLVAPIEGVKARLQVQYNAGTATYKGPVDCFRKVCGRDPIRSAHGAVRKMVLTGPESLGDFHPNVL